ncbi:MAG: outer membrane lipoprotein-sorting protein [Thermoanaerobaculia bacterium]
MSLLILAPLVSVFVPAAPARAQAPVAAAAPNSDAKALLDRADRIKNEWMEAVLTLRVTTEKPGAPISAVTVEVTVKAGTKARIRFVEPPEPGKFFLTVGEDAWLILPNTRNPIRIPKSHRLSGGFSAADISRTRFSEDYDAVNERTDTLEGRLCDVLRLTARRDRKPSYPIVRVWIDRKDSLYRKAVFLLPSGKTAKETTFDSYRPYHGVLSLEKQTIVDTLRPGVTRVEYLDYEKKPVPDSVFDPRTGLTPAR